MSSLYRAPSPSPYAPRAPSPSPYAQRAPSPLPYARAPSPSPFAPRAPSPLPYGPPSPVPPTQMLPAPNSGGHIQPGTITYTTTTSPDGKVTYHPFKAVPVSYQTSNGIVSGIQWVPAEATSVLPAGAQPANADFISSWNRGTRDDKALKEWQKDEERRIHKEEKEAAKRLRKERDRQARERDARSNATGPYGAYTNPMHDLDRRMDGVDLNRARNPPVGEYNRSPYQHPIAPPSPNMAPTALGYPSAGAGYPSPQPGHGADIYRSPSPFRAPGSHSEPTAILSRSRAPSPNPMAGIYTPRSRAPSPLPGAPPPYSGQPGYPGAGPYHNALPRSPRVGGGAVLPPAEQVLPPPDGFSRPANLAQSYAFFDAMKVQDMDDFYENMPRMPKVLVPHDVYHEDWIRFIQDIALAWAGKLPTTSPDRASRPSVVTAELIDLWNNSFFAPRGVDVVLYKGHERRSGPWAGQIERNLPGFHENSDSDSSDSSSDTSSSRLSDDRYGRGPGAAGGHYGSYAADSKRRKAERKAEKKRKRKEKKALRRARERERTYALYISCIPPRDGAHGAY
ncbi:hypothetical protein F5148DRAFT_1202727 [Russula earlei]|uniref:Uncharacterized protein n=1 Tax=Russula earlei TaxID=71964 RepID=A0ACC0U7M8_9AGAM|nr:hypothetical protein F5148DRAFT_1202727 [Russula earlei]